MTSEPSGQPALDRRDFLQTTSASLALGAAACARPAPFGYHHSVDDTIRVGLVGCGGRGTGAAINACNADSNARLVAVADAFPERIESCLENLQRSDIAAKIDVPAERRFSGIDCYLPLIQSDVDVVLLCEPPHFRPRSLQAALKAGKHVFCEKPVGVDVPGVLEVMRACEQAGPLSVVSGLCWRYDLGVREIISRIHEGAIGEIKTIQENYLTNELWHRGKDPAWTPLEYQLRNWLYFSWLSGDIPLEQHIHSLDKALWLMRDEPPVQCYGMGGRQKRTGPEWGNVYDHFAVCYEWENGVRTYSYCRQMNGCFNETDDWVFGTDGRARVLKFTIENGEGTWRYRGRSPSMYDVEHEYLFRSIREGTPINNGRYMSLSTLMAIMGREACYTGQLIKWDELLNDQTRLGPTSYDQHDFDPGPVPVPGRG